VAGWSLKRTELEEIMEVDVSETDTGSCGSFVVGDEGVYEDADGEESAWEEMQDVIEQSRRVIEKLRRKLRQKCAEHSVLVKKCYGQSVEAECYCGEYEGFVQGGRRSVEK
jgi:hypothetical protein